MAGTQGLTLSRFSSAAEAHRQFPTLAERGPKGDSLKGAVRTLPSSCIPLFALSALGMCRAGGEPSLHQTNESSEVSPEMAGERDRRVYGWCSSEDADIAAV